MRQNDTSEAQVQGTQQPTVQPTKQAELLQIIEYFATKICKVRKCVYLCDANRCYWHQQSTYSDAYKALPFVHFQIADSVCSQNLTGQRLFYCPTYITNF